MPARGVLALICLLFGLTLVSAPGNNRLFAQEPEVDLALVLAIDCSFSVDANEFRLQMQGLGQAFLRPEIQEAIAKGPNGRIAVVAMQWSDEANQMIIIPWTVVASRQEVERLGAALTEIPRRLAEGGTSISMAIEFAAALFPSGPPTIIMTMNDNGTAHTARPPSRAASRPTATIARMWSRPAIG